MKVLYLGQEYGTSLDRARALERIGCRLTHIDLRSLLPRRAWVDRAIWRLGAGLFDPFLALRLADVLHGRKFDLCFVDGGELVTSGVLRTIRSVAPGVLNYNVDDPTGSRDGRRFAAYRRNIALYDLAVVVRKENVQEVSDRGCSRVLRVFRSADEIMHAPRSLTDADRLTWQSEVLFVGTWMPGRGAFLLELIRAGLPVTIRGDHWSRDPDWARLAPHWRGPAVEGDDYAKAIQCAKVCIGLLSKGNRDLHTTRSMEIPALGGLFCAERTSEHLGLYEEGVEAVFWDSATECAQVCRQLLADEPRRAAIAEAGRQRQGRSVHWNEQVARLILSQAFE